MTSKPLPENIDKIREAVAREMAEADDYSWKVLMGEIPMGKTADPEYWEAERAKRLAKYFHRADQFLSKLDELGVVKLAEDQIWRGKIDKDGNITGVDKLFKVVSIVTGTPKEG
jgi:hypothetical protein